MAKILITGGNSATAMKLAKMLDQHHLVLADYGDTPLLKNEQLEFISLGKENKDVTAHSLLTACLDFQVDILLPLRVFEMEALVKSRILFEEFGISVMVPQQNLDSFLPTRKSSSIVLNNGHEVLIGVGALANEPLGAFYQDEDGFTLITI